MQYLKIIRIPALSMIFLTNTHQLSNQDFMNRLMILNICPSLQIASMQAMRKWHNMRKQTIQCPFRKEVTVAKNNIGGTISKDRGIITQISLLNGEYKITVNDKTYELSEIMLVHDSSSPAKDSNTPSTDESTDS